MVSGIRGVEWDAVELPSQFMVSRCSRPLLHPKVEFLYEYTNFERLPKLEEPSWQRKKRRIWCLVWCACMWGHVQGGPSAVWK